jgi:outer membrane protein TolC
VSVAAEDFPDLFEGRSFESFGGPTFRWAILNYGRITNNVRVQDARFQALVGEYETVVLRAQAEVESALAAFLGAQRRLAALERSVEASVRAVELADVQYREGAFDYTRVLDTQQFLVTGQDRMVATKGTVALNLTALYKALGGGWEVRMGNDFVPDDVKDQMRERTRWGGMLGSERQQRTVDAAASGTEQDRGWFRWRAWWPSW